MHEALGWLMLHYGNVKLWMGLETEDGAELYLTCRPSKTEEIVHRLKVYDDGISLFEDAIAVGE